MALSNPFPHIVITQADVQNYFSQVLDYLHGSETTISHEINQALCQLYDDIKNQYRGVKLDDEIEELRDYEVSRPIERKICYQVIANVMMNHGSVDESLIYQAKADQIAILDIAFSEDETVTDAEKTGESLSQIRFGR
jgi:septum formation inhibitor-activating ATPase MinD